MIKHRLIIFFLLVNLGLASVWNAYLQKTIVAQQKQIVDLYAHVAGTYKDLGALADGVRKNSESIGILSKSLEAQIKKNRSTIFIMPQPNVDQSLPVPPKPGNPVVYNGRSYSRSFL